MSLTIKLDEIWVALMPVDFRKGVNGLCALVHDYFGKNPQRGMYIFYNTARNRLKLLTWHHNGFLLLSKRLERGRFPLRFSAGGKQTLTQQQLQGLLLGLDWQTISDFEGIHFEHYY